MLFTHDDLIIAVQLIVAAILGGVIGFERELHGKEAGVRTYALVSLGSALIMIVSTQIYFIYKVSGTDPSRIAAQVVSGIGFLGAGAIIRFPPGGKEGVKGLTTAAGIWTASGIGLACGIGLYIPAIITVAVTLFILLIFSKVDRFFGGRDN